MTASDRFQQTMQRFFFDLVGELSARDVLGHMCSSRREAKEHAAFIAHRIERSGQASRNLAIA
jgi:hypothetical protein